MAHSRLTCRLLTLLQLCRALLWAPWQHTPHPCWPLPLTGLALLLPWTTACSSAWLRSPLLKLPPSAALVHSRYQLLLHTTTCIGVGQVDGSGPWHVLTTHQWPVQSSCQSRAGTWWWMPAPAQQLSLGAWSAGRWVGQATLCARSRWYMHRPIMITTHTKSRTRHTQSDTQGPAASVPHMHGQQRYGACRSALGASQQEVGE